MKCTAWKRREGAFGNQWSEEVEDHWEYNDFRNDPGWRKDWISFDCLCHYPEHDTVYAGITSFDADIFWGFDRVKQQFIPTGYERVADPFDAKFHRSLVVYDGCLYGAIALLHDVDRFYEAPGGAIVKYDPRSGEIEKLGIPLPYVYIQSMVLDAKRGALYAQTFAPEHLIRFDLADKLIAPNAKRSSSPDDIYAKM